MSDYDSSAYLKAIHANHKVNKVINRLVKTNEKINFNIVSSEANVPKATLHFEKSLLKMEVTFLLIFIKNFINLMRVIELKHSFSTINPIKKTIKNDGLTY